MGGKFIIGSCLFPKLGAPQFSCNHMTLQSAACNTSYTTPFVHKLGSDLFSASNPSMELTRVCKQELPNIWTESTRSRELHMSASKAIVHHLVKHRILQRSVSMERSSFVALLVAPVALAAFPNFFSSPQYKGPSPLRIGVFPSGGRCGGVALYFALELLAWRVSASINLDGNGK